MTDPVAERDAGAMAAADALMDTCIPFFGDWRLYPKARALRDAIYAALLSERHRAEEAMRERAAAEAKTLAERLRQISGDRVAFVSEFKNALIWAADFLDRLSAPVEGVGLTRYGWVRDDEADGGRDVRPTPDGQWVRFEDVATALAAKEAERARCCQGWGEAELQTEKLETERDALKAALVMDAAHPAREKIVGAIRAFTSATVSEANDATLAILRIISNSLPAPIQPRCQHCNDTGLVALNATTGIYARPGPVPCDARGYAEAPCWECNTYPGGFDGPTGAD